MLITRHLFTRRNLFLRSLIAGKLSSYSKTTPKFEVDAYGIPAMPTWSVNDLLASYPKPTLSSSTLTKLHDLAALSPPEEGSQEHKRLKGELEELIRLVEAVKLVDTSDVQYEHWGPEMDIEAINEFALEEEEKVGRDLLEYAERTQDGFYVVEADRRRNS
ncbi:hypothetical protein Moror_10797 [Moniliophthora roreri MCA 2997]|uniref:Uncharacterized protein n=2 Tax=Moniliophthora roreri TaxID=221103 RepID=V2X5F7_MONRO|nr:hypothetical protein Moror_10797 [Moniliophthora roreri MCA 2997]KAI3596738.1 hypothetical protein WG66_016377 [Moniliophthora roreri]